MDFIIDVARFRKAKSIVTSLYEVMFFTSIFPSPIMRFPIKERPPSHPAGLKAILSFSQGPQNPTTHQYPCHILHSFMIPPQSPSSTTSSRPLLRSLTNSTSYSSSSSSALDDLIGTESGVCMNSINMEEDGAEKVQKLPKEGERQRSCYARRKKYPPSIPLLARTGNLPGHMPWVLTRHYIDGKLILIEERVKHHEYFEAYKENGRLILNLVSLDDTINISCSHSINPKNERDQEIQDLGFIEDGNETQGNSSDQEEEAAEDREINHHYGDNWEEYLEVNEKSVAAATWASVPKSSLKNGSSEKGGGDLRRCFTFAGKMISDSGNLPCNANSHQNAATTTNTTNVCIHRSGLTSLAFGSIRRPMTTVV